MSIQSSYPTISKIPNEYIFRSIGKKGTIIKVVLYEHIKENRYNLSFGDLIAGEVNDEIVSNNNDLIKVISTVVSTIYDFTNDNPDSIIEIKGVDEKRIRLYNSIFKRRVQEIEEQFMIFGITNERKRERYDPEYFYYKFEITKKKL